MAATAAAAAAVEGRCGIKGMLGEVTGAALRIPLLKEPEEPLCPECFSMVRFNTCNEMRRESSSLMRIWCSMLVNSDDKLDYDNDVDTHYYVWPYLHT